MMPCSPRIRCWLAANAYDASLAHHAIGIVLRDRGNLPEAITELKKGLKLAQASGQCEREVDVQASLGVTLAWTGRSQQGLAMLNRAVEESRGDMAGRVLMRRAYILWDMGRFREAHEDVSRAPASFPPGRRHGVGGAVAYPPGFRLPGARTPWAGKRRLRPGRRGSTRPVIRNSNTPRPGTIARWWRSIHGDLPEALTYLDEAGNRYDALGETLLDLPIDRCWAQLAAGLAGEAAEETETALAGCRQGEA